MGLVDIWVVEVPHDYRWSRIKGKTIQIRMQGQR